jgi:hypothetical protein
MKKSKISLWKLEADASKVRGFSLRTALFVGNVMLEIHLG